MSDLHFGPYDPDRLREAFTEASRRFWLRENESHSVRVPQPRLRLVTDDDFDELVEAHERKLR